MSDDRERGHLALLIRPDEILAIAIENRSLLELIRDWKIGLTTLLTEKVSAAMGLPVKIDRQAPGWTGRFVNFLTESVRASAAATPDESKVKSVDRFLASGRVMVYLDDLDRGWAGRPQDIRRISALLNAVRDLASDNPGLHFRVALRSDVYFLVRTSDESTDKIESSVIWYSWTNHQIFILLLKRIETFFGRQFDEDRYKESPQEELGYLLHSIMEERFTGKGHWLNAPTHRVLMSLIRKRPRDLVKLCTAAARQAHGSRSPRIGTKHLLSVFQDYSQGRIQDTINEYRTELPEVERLIMGMKPTRRDHRLRDAYYFASDELLNKIGRIQETGSFQFASSTVRASASELAQFLYKINFLIARKEHASGEVIRKYFEENRYLSSSFVDFGYAWEVHPAYRWALQPDSIDDLLYSIKLSADENGTS